MCSAVGLKVIVGNHFYHFESPMIMSAAKALPEQHRVSLELFGCDHWEASSTVLNQWCITSHTTQWEWKKTTAPTTSSRSYHISARFWLHAPTDDVNITGCLSASYLKRSLSLFVREDVDFCNSWLWSSVQSGIKKFKRVTCFFCDSFCKVNKRGVATVITLRGLSLHKSSIISTEASQTQPQVWNYTWTS